MESLGGLGSDLIVSHLLGMRWSPKLVFLTSSHVVQILLVKELHLEKKLH